MFPSDRNTGSSANLTIFDVCSASPSFWTKWRRGNWRPETATKFDSFHARANKLSHIHTSMHKYQHTHRHIQLPIRGQTRTYVRAHM